MTNSEAVSGWAPGACTLPTVEQPLRLAEFDDVFGAAVRAVERPSATRARLALEPSPEVSATVAALVVRETRCCSFFTFTLTATAGALALDIAAPPEHADVIDALAARAQQVLRDGQAPADPVGA